VHSATASPQCCGRRAPKSGMGLRATRPKRYPFSPLILRRPRPAPKLLDRADPQAPQGPPASGLELESGAAQRARRRSWGLPTSPPPPGLQNPRASARSEVAVGMMALSSRPSCSMRTPTSCRRGPFALGRRECLPSPDAGEGRSVRIFAKGVHLVPEAEPSTVEGDTRETGHNREVGVPVALGFAVPGS
jgi:hypothetical protein